MCDDRSPVRLTLLTVRRDSKLTHGSGDLVCALFFSRSFFFGKPYGEQENASLVSQLRLKSGEQPLFGSGALLGPGSFSHCRRGGDIRGTCSWTAPDISTRHDDVNGTEKE